MILTRAFPNSLAFRKLRGSHIRVQSVSSYVRTLKQRKTAAARFSTSTIRSKVLSGERAQEENWKCRQDLATAYRGMAWYNLHEGVATHLTLMAPARDGNGLVMLVIKYGEHWSEVSLVRNCFI